MMQCYVIACEKCDLRGCNAIACNCSSPFFSQLCWLVSRLVSQSVGWLVVGPLVAKLSQSVSQLVSWSVGQSVVQLVGQLVSRSGGWLSVPW